MVRRREDFRERDERVVLYTREFGKISVIAKGVKRIEAKLRGNLDIFNLADITFVQGSYFSILTGVDLKERFLHIVNSPATYNAALAAAKTDNTYSGTFGKMIASRSPGCNPNARKPAATAWPVPPPM